MTIINRTPPLLSHKNNKNKNEKMYKKYLTITFIRTQTIHKCCLALNDARYTQHFNALEVVRRLAFLEMFSRFLL